MPRTLGEWPTYRRVPEAGDSDPAARPLSGARRETPPHAAEASGADTMGEQRLPYRLGSINASRRANRRDNPAPVWSARREAYEADELAIRDGDEGWTLFTEHR